MCVIGHAYAYICAADQQANVGKKTNESLSYAVDHSPRTRTHMQARLAKTSCCDRNQKLAAVMGKTERLNSSYDLTTYAQT